MVAIPDWQEPLRHGSEEAFGAPENILLPLDGSEVAKTALSAARKFGALYGATLHIVYVGERLLGERQTLRQLGLGPEEIRGAVLDDVAGDPGERMRDALERLHAPMVVASTHGGDDRRESLVGSFGDKLLDSDLERAVLVPPETCDGTWQARRVVLAHDGERSTDVATWYAADVAHRAGAEVVAIHVGARNAPGAVAPGGMSAPRYVDQPQHEWPAWANEFLDRMIALGAPPAKVHFKLMVTGGQPGSEIADFARDNHADLVVAAWHGVWHEAHERALKTIIRRSGCPVMLVHAPEPGRARRR